MTVVTDDIVAVDPHDGLDCASAEALLADSQASNASLADEVIRLRLTSQTLASDLAMAQALNRDLDKTNQVLSDQRNALTTQVEILSAELRAAEEVAAPEGALISAHLTEADLRALYRDISGRTRGPIPARVLDAVTSRADRIAAKALTAARAAARAAVKAEIG